MGLLADSLEKVLEPNWDNESVSGTRHHITFIFEDVFEDGMAFMFPKVGRRQFCSMIFKV
jgi:hypothetical protein